MHDLIRLFRVIAALWLCNLANCGTYVPQMNEAWEPADVDDKLAYRITKSIRCELVRAVEELGTRTYTDKYGRRVRYLPDDWGTQLTLTLTADETGALNPSGSYTRNIHPATDVLAPGGSVAQSFALPFTTQLSSQAVRVDTYYSFYTIQELLRKRAIDTVCATYDPATNELSPLDRSGSSYLLSGNLGIRSWLKGALAATFIPSSDVPDDKKLQVLQYDVKFVVMASGTVNPMWILAPVSTGIGGMPLASANRTKTHEMLLTFGPADIKKGRAVPDTAAINLHTFGQFQQAVSIGFRSALGR